MALHEENCDEAEQHRVHKSTVQNAAELASNIVYEGNVEHDIINYSLVHCTQHLDIGFQPEHDSLETE